MNPNAQTFRLIRPEPPRARRRAAPPEPPIINLTVQSDQILLTVSEAAHRLGISRSFMYELIAAGEIQTIHIGRLCKIDVRSVEAFVQSRIEASAAPFQIAIDK